MNWKEIGILAKMTKKNNIVYTGQFLGSFFLAYHDSLYVTT